ncbi:MAG TPA: DUF4173 domain-containing protein [Phototrophicaceae bacterium]|nr:DUF4173 domain-containing protein [Phototrophicaceae bacterium]
MERRTFAIWSVGVGLLLGLLANIFFFGRTIGVSFPLFVLLAVIAVLASSRPARQTLRRRNLWPLLPLLFFAGMVAVRADSLIVMLDILAVLALGGLVLYYLPLAHRLDEDSFIQHTTNTLEAGLELPRYAVIEAGDAWSWLREKRHQRGGAFAAVMRGLVFAAPVILVFVLLLGSADAVFAKYLDQVWQSLRDLLGLDGIPDMFARLLFTLLIAALGTGALGYAWVRRERIRPVVRVPQYMAVGNTVAPMPDSPAAEADATAADETALEAEAKAKPGMKLGMIETGIILGSVVALFALFVVIQFAYFFGGQATISVAGLTYAQYARRGFFELVAVLVLTLGLALGLDRVTVRQERPEQITFRTLCVLLVGLTTVMLVSASQRMLLYEEAFGFTQLRVYTHVFIHWLGVLFLVFLAALFRLRKNIFSLGSLLVIIGYLVTMNLLNVDFYIAERNIARYQNGADLDVAFLNILSADAVPAVVPLFRETPDNNVKYWAGQWLVRQQLLLKNDRQDASVFSLNAAREIAWGQLTVIDRLLPEYDPSAYFESYDFWNETYGLDDRSGWETDPTPGP